MANGKRQISNGPEDHVPFACCRSPFIILFRPSRVAGTAAGVIWDWTPSKAPQAFRNQGYPNWRKSLGGLAPCFAERLCLSGRNLRNIIVFRRVRAAPSRGGKQVV
jgi:hypothetical protein